MRPAILRRSRLVRLGLAALVVGSLLPLAGPAAAADAPDVLAAAERDVLGRVNATRTAAGLRPYRFDSRLATIARQRTTDMATKNYLSHVQPDGRSVFDLIAAAGITWYGAGENIGWNSVGDLAASAGYIHQQWLDSPAHRALILSANYNYAAVTQTQAADGRRYWALVTLKGPDRTGARGTMRSAARTTGSPVDGRYPVRIAWTGADVPLQVLTAGLASFHVQRRVDGGTWSTVSWAATGTATTRYLAPGHRYEFRVRARDKAGNVGAWSATIAVRI